jgi:hypothetical protein
MAGVRERCGRAAEGQEGWRGSGRGVGQRRGARQSGEWLGRAHSNFKEFWGVYVCKANENQHLMIIYTKKRQVIPLPPSPTPRTLLPSKLLSTNKPPQKQTNSHLPWTKYRIEVKV